MMNARRHLLTLLLTAATLAACAYDFEVGGLRYDKMGEGEVCLVSVAPKGGSDIVVPASITVDGMDYAVTAIGDFAFNTTGTLTSVLLPEGLRTIGYAAFQGTEIREVVIPSTVVEIGGEAFSGAGYDKEASHTQLSAGLEHISVAEGNARYDSRNGCDAVMETATGTLVVGTNNTVIPDDTRALADGAFSMCSRMTSLLLPASIEEIGRGCFYMCYGLKDIYCFWTEPVVATLPFGHPELDGFDFDAVVLHVPTDCRERYAATSGWQEFRNVVEFDPNEVDIHAITAVSQPVDDLRHDGLASQVFAPDGCRRLQLQRGLNIVRSATRAVSKILLK